jgi:hypothetical protein
LEGIFLGSLFWVQIVGWFLIEVFFYVDVFYEMGTTVFGVDFGFILSRLYEGFYLIGLSLLFLLVQMFFGD